MKNLLLLFFLGGTLFSFSQSPWVKKNNEVYAQVSFTTIRNYSTIFGNPDKKINGPLADNTFKIYAEYGLSDKTTVVLNIPYKNISQEGLVSPCLIAPCPEYTNSTSSFGNIEIGLKHNFYNKKWLISGQVNIEANTGSFDAKTDIRTGYDAWTITPLFLIGKSAGNKYSQAFLGFNIRTNNYSSNFVIGGERGKKFLNKWWLIGYVDIVKSFKNGSIVLPEGFATGLYTNNQEYGTLGIKVIRELNSNFGITTSLGGAFFGNNLAKQVPLNIGFYSKF